MSEEVFIETCWILKAKAWTRNFFSIASCGEVNWKLQRRWNQQNFKCKLEVLIWNLFKTWNLVSSRKIESWSKIEFKTEKDLNAKFKFEWKCKAWNSKWKIKAKLVNSMKEIYSESNKLPSSSNRLANKLQVSISFHRLFFSTYLHKTLNIYVNFEKQGKN